MGGGVQGFDEIYQEGPQSCWRRIFLLIGYQLVSQPKFEFSHAVLAGFVSTHGCKKFTNGAEVFLNRLLLNGLPLRGQKSGMYALGKIWRNRMGSSVPSRSGEICSQLQKHRHWSQAVVYFLKTVEDNPLEIDFLCIIVFI